MIALVMMMMVVEKEEEGDKDSQTRQTKEFEGREKENKREKRGYILHLLVVFFTLFTLFFTLECVVTHSSSSSLWIFSYDILYSHVPSSSSCLLSVCLSFHIPFYEFPSARNPDVPLSVRLFRVICPLVMNNGPEVLVTESVGNERRADLF